MVWKPIYSDDVKPQLALIAPHGAEILQIRKKLFVEHISQDLRSILSVMVSYNSLKILQLLWLKKQSYPTYKDIKQSQDQHIQWEMYKGSLMTGMFKVPKSSEINLSASNIF